MSIEKLQVAASAKRAAEAAYANVSVRAIEHSYRASADVRRLADLQKQQENHRVAVALGDDTDLQVPDEEEIERLTGELSVNSRVADTFATRVSAAEKRVVAAKDKHREAAQAYVIGEAIEPARLAFVAALEQLRAAAVDLMAANVTAYVDFAPNKAYGFYSTEDMYGPAAHLVRVMSLGKFWDYPYSTRPDWLPQHGPFDPWGMAGVEEGRRALHSKIEGVTE